MPQNILIEARKKHALRETDVGIELSKQTEQYPSEKILNEPGALVELIAVFLEWMQVIREGDFSSEDLGYEDPRDRVSILAYMYWRRMKFTALSLIAVNTIKRLPVNGNDLLEVCELFYAGYDRLGKIENMTPTITYKQTIVEAEESIRQSIHRMLDLKFVATEYLRLSKPSKRPDADADLMRRTLFDFAESDTDTILREFKKQRIVNGKPKGIRRAEALKLIRQIQSGEI